MRQYMRSKLFHSKLHVTCVSHTLRISIIYKFITFLVDCMSTTMNMHCVCMCVCVCMRDWLVTPLPCGFHSHTFSSPVMHKTHSLCFRLVTCGSKWTMMLFVDKQGIWGQKISEPTTSRRCHPMQGIL